MLLLLNVLRLTTAASSTLEKAAASESAEAESVMSAGARQRFVADSARLHLHRLHPTPVGQPDDDFFFPTKTTTRTSSRVVTRDVELGCAPGWSLVDGRKCVRVIDQLHASWPRALAFCARFLGRKIGKKYLIAF
jgi:hypothetical protein